MADMKIQMRLLQDRNINIIPSGWCAKGLQYFKKDGSKPGLRKPKLKTKNQNNYSVISYEISLEDKVEKKFYVASCS